MPIPVSCQACGFAFKVGDEFAGKRGRCPKCSQIFQVPVAKAAKRPPPPTPPSASSSSSRVSLSAPFKKAAPLGEGSRLAKSSASSSSLAKRAAPEDTQGPADAFPGIVTDGDASSSSVLSGSKKTSSSPGKSSVLTKGGKGAAASRGGGLVDVKPDDRPSSYSSRRRPGVSIPVWVWFVVGGLGLFSALGYVYYDSTQPAEPLVQQPPPPPKDLSLNLKPMGRPTSGNEPVVEIKKPGPDAPLEDVVAYVEHGIVKIDTYDGWDRNGTGSGFVIDQSGLVATNYHVVDDCINAAVLFSNGERFGIEGYVAVQPENDLAILKLNGFPANMRALELRHDPHPRQASKVYAIGHPHDYKFNVTDGIVSSVAPTSQLPQSSQDFLHTSMTDKIDHLWVQHSAQISGGNSGGPLINAQGEVVGINTWVDDGIRSAFALHIGHLQEMLQHRLPTVEPLSKYRRAPQMASQRVQVQLNVSPDRMQQLFDKMTKDDWQPQSREDYSQYRELAHVISFVYHVRDGEYARFGITEAIMEQLSQKAEKIVEGISQVDWSADPQIKSVNTYAAGSTFDPGEGEFFFGTIEKLFKNGETGELALVLRVTGNEQEVLIYTEAAGRESLKAGGQCLVLGVGRGEQTLNQDPLNQIKLPMVLSKTILPIVPMGN